MPETRILIADSLHTSGKKILDAAAQVDDRGGISAAELLELIPAYDALIVRGRTKVNAQVFL